MSSGSVISRRAFTCSPLYRLWLVCALALSACGRVESTPARDFVVVDAQVIALTHVRIIDGSGTPGRPNQTVLIRAGTIAETGDAARVRPPEGAKVIDLPGRTVLPGFVMLHEHLFYTPDGGGYTSTPFTFAVLYLAGGTTTIRTAGSASWTKDLELRNAVDKGDTAGPQIDLTSPYLNGSGLTVFGFGSRSDGARSLTTKWADEGATSFKAYEQLTREELAAVIEEAHRRGLKVTGHLCATTFGEAAALGIDNLEHGLLVASDFVTDKKPDECPSPDRVLGAVLRADPIAVRRLIDTLVARRVAITSTLPVFETFVSSRQPAADAALELLAPAARARYERSRAALAAEPQPVWETLLKREMDFERAFVRAGGLLTAGTDPTGRGGVIAGFSNQRAIELLVEAGFSATEAIHIVTLNGARYLDRDARIGTIEAGKQADLVIVRGNPEERISAVEEVEVVFKNGVGYDSVKLRESVRGAVGLR